MQIIINAIQATCEAKGVEYFARRAGSFFDGIDRNDGLAHAKLYESADWTDVTEEVVAMGAALPNVTYLRAPIPEGLTGKVGMKLAEELTDEELPNVRLVRGLHGPELQLDMDVQDTNVMHLMIADTSSWPPAKPPTLETARVITGYPGPLTANTDWANTAVKRPG